MLLVGPLELAGVKPFLKEVLVILTPVAPRRFQPGLRNTSLTVALYS